MFTSTRLFANVPCPQRDGCTLNNCIFSHESAQDLTSKGIGLHDPLDAGEPTPPHPKRRRVDSSKGKSQRGQLLGNKVTGDANPLDGNLEHTQGDTRTTAAHTSTLRGTISVPSSSNNALTSTKRSISPPSSRNKEEGTVPRIRNAAARAISSLGAQPATMTPQPKETLNPRMIAKTPAPHGTRLLLLKKIHDSYKMLNDQLSKQKDVQAGLVLSQDELIVMSLDEEEQIALQNGNHDIYRSVIGGRIRAIGKYKLDEWKCLVLGKFKQKYLPALESRKPIKTEVSSLSTGLSTTEEVALLRHLRTPLQGLEAHGYVTSPPSDADIAAARDGVKAAAGWETCDRCSTRFQVFPGRNEQGQLTSKGSCRYHWAKIYRPIRQKNDHITGQQEPSYPCCSGSVGSSGCTNGGTHVYKVSEAKRMASILQFERTPLPKDQARSRPPVSFDCEMAYTALGMELVRLTAVSWPKGTNLLDVLVRPQGEVLDFNSRFSGVTKDMFSKAVPYGTEAPRLGDSGSEDGELESEPLQKVDSPMAARQLLFELLTPDTPLLGHAIDNDLNTCRVIHPFIIDTVLLFPHPRGLPIRYGLKMLTNKYLGRSIQAGGALGHDSREDAQATGDLVHFKVGEKWRQMRREGWTLIKGVLNPPKDEVKISTGPRASKRTHHQVESADELEDDRPAA